MTYKSAWFLEHRIRKAMETEEPMLSGIIEADETYIGGRSRSKHVRGLARIHRRHGVGLIRRRMKGAGKSRHGFDPERIGAGAECVGGTHSSLRWIGA